MTYTCPLDSSFSEYRGRTMTLIGKLRRELEYREKHGKPCGSDKHLLEEIDLFLEDVKEDSKK